MVVTRLASPIDSAHIAHLWATAATEYRSTCGLPAASVSESVREKAHQQRVLGYLTDPTTFAVMGEDEGKPVAVAFVAPARTEDDVTPEPIPGLAHVSMLAVSPQRWGQGLGSTILKAVHTLAGERGFSRAQLWTHAANWRARRLYERLGWRVSRRTGIDDHGVPIRHYIRDL